MKGSTGSLLTHESLFSLFSLGLLFTVWPLSLTAFAAPRNIEFRLGADEAKPGQQVELSLSINSDGAYQGFEFSIDFDESSLVVEEIFEVLEGLPRNDFEAYEFNNDNDVPGNAGVDEGFVAGRVIVSASENILPANEEIEVLRILFTILDDAPEGVLRPRFVDGAGGLGITFENALMADGARVTAVEAESFALIAGRVEVLSRGPAFIRGDVNSDRVISLSDSHRLLNWLFRGAVEPPCLESAELHGDEEINIADAISILGFLYLEGEPPPAPFPDPGIDLVDNGIDCVALGEGTPIEDPAARLEIVDLEIGGGDIENLQLTVKLSSSTSIGGFALTVMSDSLLFDDVAWIDSIENLEGRIGSKFEHLELDGDLFQHAILFSLERVAFIPPGEDTEIMYSVCLRDGLAAGDYTLSIVDAEFVDQESGRAIYPAVSGATLTIVDDVTSVDCVADGHQFSLGETSGGPGDEVCVPFFISTTERPTQAFAYSIDVDETRIEAVETLLVWPRPEEAKSFTIFEHNNDDFLSGSSGIDEGFLIGAFVVSLVGEHTIPTHEDSVEVLRFVMRVKEGAPPGLTKLLFRDGGIGTGQPVNNEIHIDGLRIRPTVSSGGITVLEAPVGDADCGVGPTEPPINIEISFRLGSTSGGPGELIGIPFDIRADRPSQGFEFSVDFDETLFEATDIVKRWQRPDGTSYDFFILEFNNENRVPGSHGVDEGFFAGAAITSIEDSEIVLPPDEDVEVLRFVMRIDEAAPPGESEVRFQDGAVVSDGGSVENKLIAGGTRITPALADSFVFIDGRVTILPDGILFIRGDANDDHVVNIADPQYTLGFLFQGSAPPLCLDAADANDDGEVDISDAVATLNFLFTGSLVALPPPFSGPGSDPTPDRLDCNR